MNKNNIGDILKQQRKTSGLSADHVVGCLKEYGIEIKAKTLYGYENHISMPNADVFIALCKIYNCNSIMDFFLMLPMTLFSQTGNGKLSKNTGVLTTMDGK